MIRETDAFVSCTITSVNAQGIATVEEAPFKQALFPISTVVVYEHEQQYYYPLSMEFRLIDNNVLYLTEELRVNSMSEVFRILSSSMEKEEKWSNVFELVVVHTKRRPHFGFTLRPEFEVDNAIRHVYE